MDTVDLGVIEVLDILHMMNNFLQYEGLIDRMIQRVIQRDCFIEKNPAFVL